MGVSAEKREEMKQTLSKWINTRNMQPIVDKITPLIFTDINIVDADGIIVASSKAYRIGKHHNGAHLLLEQDLDELIVEKTNDIPGVLHGVNFPITIEGVRVGMIGITGVPSEVKLIAKLVQELLQVYISKARRDHEKLQLEQLRHGFIYEWLFESGTAAQQEFEERGRMIGIEVRSKWVVGLLSFQEQFVGKERIPENIQRLTQRWLDGNGKNELTLRIGDMLIVLLSESNTQSAKQRMRQLQQTLMEIGAPCFPAGVGRCGTSREQIRQSFRDSKIACKLSKRDPEHPVCSYDELGLDLLVDLVPQEEKVRIFNRIFREYSMEEIAQTIDMLRIYVKYNGSISKTAEQMHIHKNSLQYRLHKLSERTGLVPQNIAHMSLLYALILIYDAVIFPSREK